MRVVSLFLRSLFVCVLSLSALGPAVAKDKPTTQKSHALRLENLDVKGPLNLFKVMALLGKLQTEAKDSALRAGLSLPDRLFLELTLKPDGSVAKMRVPHDSSKSARHISGHFKQADFGTLRDSASLSFTLVFAD